MDRLTSADDDSYARGGVHSVHGSNVVHKHHKVAHVRHDKAKSSRRRQGGPSGSSYALLTPAKHKRKEPRGVDGTQVGQVLAPSQPFRLHQGETQFM